MAHARSIAFNRTMAIALAAGVGISGLAIAPSYSGVSLVPSAYAQENGGENKMSEQFQPAYSPTYVSPGQVATYPYYGERVPSGTVFSIAEAPNGYDEATIDPVTGTVTFKASSLGNKGVNNFTIGVEYPDGSKDMIDRSYRVSQVQVDNYRYFKMIGQLTPGQSQENIPYTNHFGDTYFDQNGEGFKFTDLKVNFQPNNEETIDWVTIDSATGEVDINVPEDVAFGSYGFSTSIVDEEGEIVESLSFNFYVVDDDPENIADNIIYDPSLIPSSSPVSAGSETSHEVRNAGLPLPDGVSYVKNFGPDWVTLDEETGTTTIAPPEGTPAGAYQYEIKIVYPDGTESNAKAGWSLARVSPYLETLDIELGDGTAATAQLNGNVVAAEGSKVNFWRTGVYHNGKLSYAGTGWITVDPNTGAVSANPSMDVAPGIYYVGIGINGNSPSYMALGGGEVTGTVIRVTEQNYVLDGDVELKAGENASIAAPTYEDGSDLFPAAEFSAAEDNPEWITVNKDGTVTVDVPEGTDAGDYDYGVVINGPGREPTTVTATVTVVEDEVVEAPEVIFNGDATLNPGDVWDSEAPVYEDSTPIPENAEFIPSDNNPEWIVVNEDGSVTATIPEDQEPGEFTYEFDMVVDTGNGTPTTTPLGGTITVNEIEEPDTPLDIVFNGDVELDPGAQVVIDSPVYDDGTDLPDGTEFEGTEDNPDWVEVNEDGTITVNVPTDQEPGDYDYDLIVTVPGEDPVNLGGTITVNDQEPTEEPTEDPTEEPTTTEPTEEPTTTEPTEEPTTTEPTEEPTTTEPTTTSAKDDVDKTPTRTVSVSVTAKPVDGNNNSGNNNSGNNNSSSDKGNGKDAANYGPKVNTGGTVENVSFWDKVKSFFA